MQALSQHQVVESLRMWLFYARVLSSAEIGSNLSDSLQQFCNVVAKSKTSLMWPWKVLYKLFWWRCCVPMLLPCWGSGTFVFMSWKTCGCYFMFATVQTACTWKLVWIQCFFNYYSNTHMHGCCYRDHSEAMLSFVSWLSTVLCLVSQFYLNV